jgi:hypothetical protein
MSRRAAALKVNVMEANVLAPMVPVSLRTTVCTHGRVVVVVVTGVELLLPPPQAGSARARAKPTASFCVLMFHPFI